MCASTTSPTLKPLRLGLTKQRNAGSDAPCHVDRMRGEGCIVSGHKKCYPRRTSAPTVTAAAIASVTKSLVPMLEFPTSMTNASAAVGRVPREPRFHHLRREKKIKCPDRSHVDTHTKRLDHATGKTRSWPRRDGSTEFSLLKMAATINVRLSDASTFSASIDVFSPTGPRASLPTLLASRTNTPAPQLTQTVVEFKRAIAPLCSPPPCPTRVPEAGVQREEFLKDGDTLESYGN